MDADDQGHRYGNFPNYYSFHPPKNRLDVLTKSGILYYIRRKIHKEVHNDAQPSVNSTADATRDTLGKAAAHPTQDVLSTMVDSKLEDRSEESLRKKPRLGDSKICGNSATKKQIASDIFYCDLGCNEGDLTLAMARTLADIGTHDVAGTVEEDVQKLGKGGEAHSPEGAGDTNLLPIANGYVDITCLGLDIDPMLVERAKRKDTALISNSDVAKVENFKPKLKAVFQVANLCSESEHNGAYAAFAERISFPMGSIGQEDAQQSESFLSTTPKRIFDLTTIFSTTMWIHVHAGDEGLQKFLERACSWTKQFMLIEPQPSGCYRKANVQLRKMGRPELSDITSNRLKMRPDIETEIKNIIVRCGFQRVSLTEIMSGRYSNESRENGMDKVTAEEAVTSWNRTLHLYERIGD